MHMWHQFNFFDSFIMLIFWVIIIALVVFVIVKLTKKPKQEQWTIEKDALDILKERLARGEIDENEYRRLKEILEDDL